jgi:hypothetical protein
MSRSPADSLRAYRTKHLEAEEIAVCRTWRHSFGLEQEGSEFILAVVGARGGLRQGMTWQIPLAW